MASPETINAKSMIARVRALNCGVPCIRDRNVRRSEEVVEQRVLRMHLSQWTPINHRGHSMRNDPLATRSMLPPMKMKR